MASEATDTLRAAIIAALKRRGAIDDLDVTPSLTLLGSRTSTASVVLYGPDGVVIDVVARAGDDAKALRGVAFACGLREAPCPACDGRGRRAYGREVEDGCDECECAGVVVVDPAEEVERLRAENARLLNAIESQLCDATRERDESIAIERERCAALVREIPACQPGAKATAARRWLDDRVAACVRAIVVDDETATCARASVRDAMERAKAAEADAARAREAYAIDLAGLRDTLRRADDLRVMWRERVADVASERDALRTELDATRAAFREDLHCDECHAVATHETEGRGYVACDAHATGDGWRELPHAAAVRAALR